MWDFSYKSTAHYGGNYLNSSSWNRHQSSRGCRLFKHRSIDFPSWISRPIKKLLFLLFSSPSEQFSYSRQFLSGHDNWDDYQTNWMTQTRKTRENRRLSTVDSKVRFWNGNGLTIKKKKKKKKKKTKENQGWGEGLHWQGFVLADLYSRICLWNVIKCMCGMGRVGEGSVIEDLSHC